MPSHISTYEQHIIEHINEQLKVLLSEDLKASAKVSVVKVRPLAGDPVNTAADQHRKRSLHFKLLLFAGHIVQMACAQVRSSVQFGQTDAVRVSRAAPG